MRRESRRLAELDIKLFLHEALVQGAQLGFEQGLENGLENGLKRTRILGLVE